MSTKSSAGWIIMAAALAVPGFMFYNWRTHLNTQSRADLEKRVRNRLPEGAPIFGAAPAQHKLNNPIVEAPVSQAATAQALATPSAPAIAAAAPPEVAAAPPALAVSTPAANQSPSSPSSSAPLLQTGPIAEITLARDPMLSPYDKATLAEAELKQRLAREELEEAAHSRRVRKRAPAEKPAERLVDLQGIVSTAGGNKAIVNGEVVGEGDFVGSVKVLKISPSGVVFLHKNKRFIKGMDK